MLKRNRIIQGASRIFVAFFFLFFLSFESLFAQQSAHVFLPGEKLTYGAYYNWHFIWVNAGEVVFRTDTIRTKAEKEWDFYAVGKTYKAYDFFYSARDTFQSHVAFDGFKADYFYRCINHSKKSSVHQYHFDSGTGKIYSFIHRVDKDPFRDTLDWKPNTLDLLSTVYSFRDYPFESLLQGQQVNFRMLVDNKVEDLYFRYLGKEELKTRNGRKFLCHKVMIRLLGGDFFPDGKYMKVWFTHDKNHIPVRVETEILVGSVNAILTDLEHVKYPLTSEIK